MKLRETLEKRERWIRGDFARTATDDVTFPTRATATKFCLLGGCAHFGVPTDVIRRALPDAYGTGVIGFNDDPFTTHADVLAVIDRAIAMETSA